jgi:hypothetical protein
MRENGKVAEGQVRGTGRWKGSAGVEGEDGMCGGTKGLVLEFWFLVWVLRGLISVSLNIGGFWVGSP